MTSPVSARKSGNNYIHSTGPDVCWTPMGGNMVKVPYNSIVFFGNSTRTLNQVKDNHLADFNMNSRAKGVTGHEPGTGKGVKVPGYLKYAGPIKSTSTICTDGRPIIRDGDDAMINSPTEQAQEKQAMWHKETLS